MAKITAPISFRSPSLIAPLIIFLFLAGLFLLSLSRGDPSKLPSALIGRPVPEFSLPALEGLTVNGQQVPGFGHRDLAGGAVSIVNVWASWCGPCHQEHPFLTALAKRDGLSIYGLNYKDLTSTARRFLGRHGNPFVAVGRDKTGKTAIDWGVYGVPETFVIDGKGTVIYKHVGPLDEDAIENKLLPAIRSVRDVG